MKKDIILCGVGGQGILSIATVIGAAATRCGLYLKQAEVHGMSQRGGDVESDLRLSEEPIWSDLIPDGGADLIISMEPMEALRYLPRLSPRGTVITASKPLVNIPDYPPMEEIDRALDALPSVVKLDIEAISKETGNPRGANMVLLGAAARHIEITSVPALADAVAEVFRAKGPAVVEANLKSFIKGTEQ